MCQSIDAGDEEPPLEAKVRFLQARGSYPDGPAGAVETIETHFAYVFLTPGFAYKLKKPIRFHEIDFRALASRQASCESELVLNRRLAAPVYIDVVPLFVGYGGLALGAPARGVVVDWLVKMRRLPREQMLDARLPRGQISDAELRALVAKLAAFYARTRRAAWIDDAGYAGHLERQLRTVYAELAPRASVFDGTITKRLVDAQLEFVRERADDIAMRDAAGRVVDAHGDLRPEHILLGAQPQVIDCLEFSAELRVLDTAEEIAFLALECSELGRRDVAQRILTLYRELCLDALPQPLLEFYSSRRALGRALSCAWHLDEPLSIEARKHWTGRTLRYLDAARAAIGRAGDPA